MTGTGSIAWYVREMWHEPQNTGSIAASGRALARQMANSVDPLVDGVIVELGPGTGAVTQALIESGIAANRLLLIEANPRFVKFLRGRFPDVQIVQGDAWKIEEHLFKHRPRENCAAVVSGLPLLNFPQLQRLVLLETVMALLKDGGGSFIQFSYGLKAPLKMLPNVTVRRSHWILRNVPPARVWVYKNT